jgi:hypothetical protein
MHSHIAIAPPQITRGGSPDLRFFPSAPPVEVGQRSPLPSITFSALSNPAMLEWTRQTTSGGEAPVATSSTTASTTRSVSLEEYQRVCANEQTLAGNVETLKALVMQMAAQLSQAQAEVQLLHRSASPCTVPCDVPADRADRAKSEASPNANLLREIEAAKRELLDVIVSKDKAIDALQHRLAAQSKQFYALLDDVTRTKDAIIARLALELDEAKRYQATT